jgi:hypothetical protein
VAVFGFVSRASMLARFALLSAIAMSARCSADVNPAAPGSTPSAASFVPAPSIVAPHLPADARKLTICHRTQATTGFTVISVAATALDAHLAHGDGRPGDPVPDQPDRTFGSDCQISSATRVTIGFSGLVGNGASFSTYTESGFAVSVTGPSVFTRDWEVATLFGNPPPFIQFRVPPGAPETSGAVRVTAGGATFRLASVDLYSSVTPIPYELRGFLNNTPVFTATGTVPNTFGTFQTVANPDADVLVDSVIVVLMNPAMSACCGNAMGLDNLVLVR